MKPDGMTAARRFFRLGGRKMEALGSLFGKKNVCMPGLYFSIIQVTWTEAGRGMAVLFICTLSRR